MNYTCLNDAAKEDKPVLVSSKALVAYFLKAKDIAEKSTNIGGDQAARLNNLMDDVVNSIKQQFRVMVDAPDYLIGVGPDLEFVVTARTLSKERARQIVRLLNKDENA